MNKRISRTSASSSQRVAPDGILRNIPTDVPHLLRRFWRFTREMARRFAHNLLDEEKKEEALLKVVKKNFRDRKGLF